MTRGWILRRATNRIHALDEFWWLYHNSGTKAALKPCKAALKFEDAKYFAFICSSLLGSALYDKGADDICELCCFPCFYHNHPRLEPLRRHRPAERHRPILDWKHRTQWRWKFRRSIFSGNLFYHCSLVNSYSIWKTKQIYFWKSGHGWFSGDQKAGSMATAVLHLQRKLTIFFLRKWASYSLWIHTSWTCFAHTKRKGCFLAEAYRQDSACARVKNCA